MGLSHGWGNWLDWKQPRRCYWGSHGGPAAGAQCCACCCDCGGTSAAALVSHVGPFGASCCAPACLRMPAASSAVRPCCRRNPQQLELTPSSQRPPATVIDYAAAAGCAGPGQVQPAGGAAQPLPDVHAVPHRAGALLCLLRLCERLLQGCSEYSCVVTVRAFSGCGTVLALLQLSISLYVSCHMLLFIVPVSLRSRLWRRSTRRRRRRRLSMLLICLGRL